MLGKGQWEPADYAQLSEKKVQNDAAVSRRARLKRILPNCPKQSYDLSLAPSC
jgi:hypothetical protein